MRPLLLLIPAAALGSIACAPTVNLDAEREALRQADAAYSQAAGSMNVDAFVGFYAADAKLYAPNSPAITGIEGIRAFATEMSSMSGFSVIFHPTSLDVSSGGDMGYTLSHYVVTVNGPDGKPVTEKGPDFHVWKKQADGSWKVLIDIWNSEDPLPTPPSR
ncbi:MAG: DUF4440 domain-containing protein [Gemmatimonadetes bacterium]|nr:DUF4440 domain-containing protein [Gemmatimonadota bacterium]